jgi:hypothetical protein
MGPMKVVGQEKNLLPERFPVYSNAKKLDISNVALNW